MALKERSEGVVVIKPYLPYLKTWEEAGPMRKTQEMKLITGKGQRKRRIFRKETQWSFSKTGSSAAGAHRRKSRVPGQCVSYFSVTVVKHHHQKQPVRQRQFTLAGPSRGVRIHLGRETWRQAGSLRVHTATTA